MHYNNYYLEKLWLANHNLVGTIGLGRDFTALCASQLLLFFQAYLEIGY